MKNSQFDTTVSISGVDGTFLGQIFAFRDDDKGPYIKYDPNPGGLANCGQSDVICYVTMTLFCGKRGEGRER